MSLSTPALKVILLFTLLAATYALSMLPLLISRYSQRASTSRARRVQTALGLMSCFAAGVFLATCLLDLFPDAHEQLDAALDEKGVKTGYPLTEFVVVLGFLFVFLIEQIVLTRKESNANDTGEHERERLFPRRGNDGDIFVDSYQSIQSRHIIEAATENEHQRGIGMRGVQRHDDHAEFESHSVIRSLMLLLALSLHSVFEGLAIGLQPTAASVLAIFLPVFLHKGIVAFALGLNLAQSDLSVKAITGSNLIFSVASPLGIGIGIIFLKFAPDSANTDLVNGIMQSLACGTFLFVVFFEILPHEFMGPRIGRRLLKTFLLALGFATVSGLLFLDPEVRHPEDKP